MSDKKNEPAPASDKVEMSKADFTLLKAAYDTLNTLWSNPKHALTVKKMVKEVRPETNIGDVEVLETVTKPINDELKATKDELAAMKKSIEDDKKKAKDDGDLKTITEKIDAVVKKRSLTEEGKAGLIKVMQDRQIADPEAAALVYLDQLPKAAPVKPNNALPSYLTPFGTSEDKDNEYKAFWENPQKAADHEITKILNEAA
jgi:hypothetical protein